MKKDNSTTYLDRVNSPEDLRRLSVDELPLYCAELRKFIIDQVSVNPGHLGSSLGALELAVAIHYVYNTPSDKLVWDVGHQAYAHKIITGRRDVFHTNRKLGGISGFPRMCESEYDAFGVGHSSTSISAALGMAVAAGLTQSQQEAVDCQDATIKAKHSQATIAVIGDGAISCGLAFEGLNNAGALGANILVVLNDNKIAIDPNVGALKEYLLGLTTSQRYNRFKNRVWNAMSGVPRLRRVVQKVEHGAKSFFLHQSNLFESLNFRYFGTVDGNDVRALVRTLRDLKNIEGPKILHTLTVKGKGYKPAEKSQTEWHAPGIFDPTTGEKGGTAMVGGASASSCKCTAKALRYQDVFGQTLVELAQNNSRIVGITPAMPTGCSMNLLMERMPERAFDVGIAEGHSVVFAAGLAAGGMMPFCNIYSSFMQRAVDNIIHDVALQNLDVVFPLDRAGLVGQDGATHHGVFDVALLRGVPNVIIGAPRNARELRDMMYTASLGGYGAAFVIRYPRGEAAGGAEAMSMPFTRQEIGISELLLHDGSDVAVLSLGTMAEVVTQAIGILDRGAAGANLSAYSESGTGSRIPVAHYDLRYAKPLDHTMLHHVAQNFEHIIIIEDGVLSAGVGSAILEFMADNNYRNHVVRLGVADHFVEHGSPAELAKLCGLDAESVAQKIQTIRL